VEKNPSIYNGFPIWENLSRHFIIPAKWGGEVREVVSHKS
jgi:hypothetical protein